MWHAAFIWLYRLSSPWLTWIPRLLRGFLGWGITLCVVMLSWIPFRARSVSDALQLVGRVFDVRAYGYLSFRENFYLITALLLVAMLALHFGVQAIRKHRSRFLLRGADLVATTVCIFVVFIFLRPVAQFIYFQF